MKYDRDGIQLWHGDVLDVLRELQDGAANMCVTSPPYWGLRDYGVEGQIGLEATPELYVCRMVAVFREVRRVLADDGVLFLNIGDSYVSQGGQRAYGGQSGTGGRPSRDSMASDSPSESLCDGCAIQFASRNQRSDGSHVQGLPASASASSLSHTARLIGRSGSSDSASPDARIAIGTSDHDSAPGLPAGAVPGAQASITHEPSQHLPGRCSHCGNCGACLAVLSSSSRDAQECVRRSQYTDGTSPRESAGRSRGTGVSDLAWGYSTTASLKPKDLVGIPWMLAFALRADGWYLRSDIIWAKPNPMPESVTDRPTKAHEYLFLLSKRATYYYNADAIREPAEWARWGAQTTPKEQQGTAKWIGPQSKAEIHARATDKQRGHSRRHAGFNDRWDGMSKEEQSSMGRNKRTVWMIATEPYPEAHFATFPPALVTPCVLAGCPEGGTVLEPFAGSGTTLQVAKQLGRKAIGIELNAEYLPLITDRLDRLPTPMPLFTLPSEQHSQAAML